MIPHAPQHAHVDQGVLSGIGSFKDIVAGDAPVRKQASIADQIASAATLLMGESSEGIPAVIIRGLDLLDESDTVKNLIRPAEEDLFR